MNEATSAEFGAVRVVGTGSIGSRYARILNSVSTMPPLLVSTRQRDLRDSFDFPVNVESPQARNLTEVDLTVIATQTGRHLADARRYATASSSLLVEKPLCASLTTAGSLDWLRELPRTQVATPLRFTDGFGRVRQLLATAGAVMSVAVECRSWLPSWRPDNDYRLSYSADPVEGGVLRDLIHEVDYLLVLLGPPASVVGGLSNQKSLQIQSEASATSIWRYEDFEAIVHLDYISRIPRRSIRIQTTDFSLYWNVLAATVSRFSHESGETVVENFPQDLDRDEAIRRQLSDLRLDPKTWIGSSLDEGIRAVHMCDLIRRSSDEGRRVTWVES